MGLGSEWLRKDNLKGLRQLPQPFLFNHISLLVTSEGSMPKDFYMTIEVIFQPIVSLCYDLQFDELTNHFGRLKLDVHLHR